VSTLAPHNRDTRRFKYLGKYADRSRHIGTDSVVTGQQYEVGSPVMGHSARVGIRAECLNQPQQQKFHVPRDLLLSKYILGLRSGILAAGIALTLHDTSADQVRIQP
jgi:hypothetical protein